MPTLSEIFAYKIRRPSGNVRFHRASGNFYQVCNTSRFYSKQRRSIGCKVFASLAITNNSSAPCGPTTYSPLVPPEVNFPRETNSTVNVACSAGVFFERAICSRKRHVETSRREERYLLSPIFHCHKIKDGGYNNITNTNKVSPTQNTPALQASRLT